MSGANFDTARLAKRRRKLDRAGGMPARADIRIVELPGSHVRVRTAGRGPSTLVFICDPPNVVEQYDEIIALLGTQHRIVVMEQPGFGFSFPKPGFGFTLPEYADALNGLLRELDMAPYVVVAPCVSTYSALLAASESRSPIRRLVLMQATSWAGQKLWAREVAKSFAIGTLGIPFGDKLNNVPYLAQVLSALTERWFPQLTHPFAVYRSKARPDVLARFMQPGIEAFRRGACNCMPSFYQKYFVGDDTGFPRPSQPTLLLWANCDYWHDNRKVMESFRGLRGSLIRVLLQEVSSDKQGLRRYVPHAHFAEIEQTGHHLELENPREVCQRIAEFVAS